MFFVDQGYKPEISKQWKIWPVEPVRQFLWRIIRASFPQERMTYIPEEAEVIYRSKDGKEEKVFDALEWPCPVKYRHAHFALASLQAFASSNVMKFNSSI